MNFYHSGEVCVNILSDDGFLCEDLPSPSTAVVVTGVEIDVGFLNDLILDYIEMLLVRLWSDLQYMQCNVT